MTLALQMESLLSATGGVVDASLRAGAGARVCALHDTPNGVACPTPLTTNEKNRKRSSSRTRSPKSLRIPLFASRPTQKGQEQPCSSSPDLDTLARPTHTFEEALSVLFPPLATKPIRNSASSFSLRLENAVPSSRPPPLHDAAIRAPARVAPPRHTHEPTCRRYAYMYPLFLTVSIATGYWQEYDGPPTERDT